MSETRSQQDLELWKAWKASPGTATLEPLLDASQGTIMKLVGLHRGKPVPPSAVATKANVLAVKAFQTYSPDKGAAVQTWVWRHVDPGLRQWIGEYQNVGRIPVGRFKDIGAYKAARDALFQELGRAPDVNELAARLNWTPKATARMETEIRKDIIGTADTTASLLKPDTTRDRLGLFYVHQELLNPNLKQDLFVFEHSVGWQGKPILSGKEIAARLGVSEPTVSRSKERIDKLLAKYGVYR